MRQGSNEAGHIVVGTPDGQTDCSHNECFEWTDRFSKHKYTDMLCMLQEIPPVGEFVGTGVGDAVGTSVGTGVGASVGDGVGSAVGSNRRTGAI